VCIFVLVTEGIDFAKQSAFLTSTNSLHETNKKVMLRNGVSVSIIDDDIVVGDIVSVNLHSLASIPADCVLLGPMADLKVDESTLTGESKLIAKRPGDVVLNGTSTIQGSGKMIDKAVGSNSSVGGKMDTNAKIIGLIGTVCAICAFAATTVTAECCCRFFSSEYILQTIVNKPFIPFWLCSDSAIDAVASFLFFVLMLVFSEMINLLCRLCIGCKEIPIDISEGEEKKIESFDHKHIKKERVPNWKLLIFVLIVAAFLLWHGTNYGPVGDEHVGIRIYFHVLGVIVIVINVLKLYFGRPRPHAYDRSRYNLDTKKCEETDTRELQDALMSYPSGHATIVTATSLLLIFELNRIPPSEPFLWLICCAFVVVVSCVSLYIAWSRVKDRWHHPSDILAGILLSICLVPILYWVELKRLSIW